MSDLEELKQRMKEEYARLFQLCLETKPDGWPHQMAYAAKQALAWALDAGAARSPFEMVEGWRKSETEPAPMISVPTAALPEGMEEQFHA
jgi:hypothetical protein